MTFAETVRVEGHQPPNTPKLVRTKPDHTGAFISRDAGSFLRSVMARRQLGSLRETRRGWPRQHSITPETASAPYLNFRGRSSLDMH